VLSQFCSLFRHRKFPSLYKILGPTFNVRNGLLFRWLFLNISSSLLVLYSFAGIFLYGIENKRINQFQSFDLIHYTGLFLILSVITNTYNKKSKGPTLMEMFTATGKLKNSLTTRDVLWVHHG